MNWREILSNSTDLDINTDLLVCADWCDENGREGAAMKLREWAQKEIVMIDEEPFLIERHEDMRRIRFQSLFQRGEWISVKFVLDTFHVTLKCRGGGIEFYSYSKIECIRAWVKNQKEIS